MPRQHLPRRAATPHPDEKCSPDNDVTGDGEESSFSEPELVVTAREELWKQPLRDGVVKAMEKDGWP
jgi:hypothetical protein